MEQRKFRRAIADFTKAARVIPDAVVASDRARWCGDQQGDAEDAARPGPAWLPLFFTVAPGSFVVYYVATSYGNRRYTIYPL